MSAAVGMWMLYALLIGGVVSVAAVAAADAQRVAHRPVRWIWFGAIVTMVGLSTVAPLRRVNGTAQIAIPPATGNAAIPTRVVTGPALFVWLNATRQIIERPLTIALHAAQRSVADLPAPVNRGLAVIWLLGSLGALGVFGASYVRVRRRMVRWPVQQVGAVQARIAPRAGPAVIGLAPPEIILPAWLLERPTDEQQLVVAHEREHVKAGDPWLLIGACAALVLFPWNPALWLAFGRLQLAIEFDCDRRVLRGGAPAAKYGSLLIEISALRHTLPSALPAFSHKSSFLERRLVAMTSRTSRFALSRRLAGGAIAAAGLITACESRLPTSADIEKADGATAAKLAAEAALTNPAKVKYIINDRPATAAEAKSIAASSLSGVEVIKAKTALDSSEIRMSTRSDEGGPMRVMADTERLLVKRKREAEVASARQGPQLFKEQFDGLLLVDGKIVETGSVASIRPETIASVEVLKGSAAAAKYADPRAQHGVILITLKSKQ